VIALMVSAHFPSVYSHRWSWLLLLLIVVTGAVVRHLMNIRFTTSWWRPALVGTVVAASLALYALLTLGAPAAAWTANVGVPSVVTFHDARHVIDRRCAACHSLQPSDSSFGAAPAGVAFDLPAQIRRTLRASASAPS
jgi:Predicted membrane protein